MSNKHLTRAITMGAAALAITGAAYAGTAIGHADSGGWRYATTKVQWGGSSCINVQAAQHYGLDTLCGYGNSWDLDERPYVGQDFGLDPIMGNASWIACQTYVDGVMVYADYASAGDGHDANCNRYLRY